MVGGNSSRSPVAASRIQRGSAPHTDHPLLAHLMQPHRGRPRASQIMIKIREALVLQSLSVGFQPDQAEARAQESAAHWLSESHMHALADPEFAAVLPEAELHGLDQLASRLESMLHDEFTVREDNLFALLEYREALAEGRQPDYSDHSRWHGYVEAQRRAGAAPWGERLKEAVNG